MKTVICLNVIITELPILLHNARHTVFNAQLPIWELRFTWRIEAIQNRYRVSVNSDRVLRVASIASSYKILLIIYNAAYEINLGGGIDIHFV